MSKVPEDTITLTIPKGSLDVIESVETVGIGRKEGVYKMLINGQPGRLMIDLSRYEYTQEGLTRMLTDVSEGFTAYHFKKFSERSEDNG